MFNEKSRMLASNVESKYENFQIKKVLYTYSKKNPICNNKQINISLDHNILPSHTLDKNLNKGNKQPVNLPNDLETATVSTSFDTVEFLSLGNESPYRDKINDDGKFDNGVEEDNQFSPPYVRTRKKLKMCHEDLNIEIKSENASNSNDSLNYDTNSLFSKPICYDSNDSFKTEIENSDDFITAATNKCESQKKSHIQSRRHGSKQYTSVKKNASIGPPTLSYLLQKYSGNDCSPVNNKSVSRGNNECNSLKSNFQSNILCDFAATSSAQTPKSSPVTNSFSDSSSEKGKTMYKTADEAEEQFRKTFRPTINSDNTSLTCENDNLIYKHENISRPAFNKDVCLPNQVTQSLYDNKEIYISINGKLYKIKKSTNPGNSNNIFDTWNKYSRKPNSSIAPYKAPSKSYIPDKFIDFKSNPHKKKSKIKLKPTIRKYTYFKKIHKSTSEKIYVLSYCNSSCKDVCKICISGARICNLHSRLNNLDTLGIKSRKRNIAPSGQLIQPLRCPRYLQVFLMDDVSKTIMKYLEENRRIKKKLSNGFLSNILKAIFLEKVCISQFSIDPQAKQRKDTITIKEFCESPDIRFLWREVENVIKSTQIDNSKPTFKFSKLMGCELYSLAFNNCLKFHISQLLKSNQQLSSMDLYLFLKNVQYLQDYQYIILLYVLPKYRDVMDKLSIVTTLCVVTNINLIVEYNLKKSLDNKRYID